MPVFAETSTAEVEEADLDGSRSRWRSRRRAGDDGARLQLVRLEHEPPVMRGSHGMHPDLQADAHVGEIALASRRDALRHIHLVAWGAAGGSQRGHLMHAD